MKMLTGLFSSALIATSLFTSSAFAASETPTIAEQQEVVSMGGGRYHECFLKGNVGCKKQEKDGRR